MECLFKGKGEVIQGGFDKGFAIGSVLEVLKVLERNFIATDENVKAEAEEIIEEIKMQEEVVKLREKLEKRLPEIKIATNLYNL